MKGKINSGFFRVNESGNLEYRWTFDGKRNGVNGKTFEDVLARMIEFKHEQGELNLIGNPVGLVYSTKEYKAFKKRSAQDIGRNYGSKTVPENILMNPILVNENYEIISGENRFDICRALGLPINYILIPKLKEEDLLIVW